jgi:hypothetical protein
MEITRVDGALWAIIGAARSVMHPTDQRHEFEVELDGSATPLRFEVGTDGRAPQRMSFRDYAFVRAGA